MNYFKWIKTSFMCLQVKYSLKENLNQVRKYAPKHAHAGCRPTHLNLFFLACLSISLTCSLVEAVKKTWWCVTRVAVIKGLCEEKAGEEDEEKGEAWRE